MPTQLNSSQLATLKAAMLADPNVTALGTQDQQIANYYNAASSPVVTVWRADMRNGDVLGALVASEVIAINVAGNLQLLQLLITPAILDASNANIRNDFTTLFASGTTSRTNLIAAAQRAGSRFETLSGFLTAAAPSNTTSVYNMRITDVDVLAARNS